MNKDGELNQLLRRKVEKKDEVAEGDGDLNKNWKR